MGISAGFAHPLQNRNALEIPGLKNLWAETLGDPRICVAVLDGPVDLTHQAFKGANLTQIETLTAANDGLAAQHGTHVASLIFGQHDSPIAGISPSCRGLLVPIFSQIKGGPPAPCSQVDLARAILQAVDAGANIINVSGGQYTPSGSAHPILADVVQRCARDGVLIVAAAGNQGCECMHIPGSLPSVLAVGAMNAAGEPLEFSNWGSIYQFQGILAPGENIIGAKAGGGLIAATGTSFATAIVSGVIALLLSLQLKHRQTPNVAAVRAAILESALGCEFQRIADCDRLLAGRLNINGAVSFHTSRGHNMSNRTEQISSSKLDADCLTAQIAPASAGSAVDVPDIEISPSMSLQSSPASASATIIGQQEMTEAGLLPAACACGGGNSPRQLVYALGQLGLDFGTEARRDSFAQDMQRLRLNADGSRAPGNPNLVKDLLDYLEPQTAADTQKPGGPFAATSLIWTLNLGSTAIYAVAPDGAFASEGYLRLRKFLKAQFTEGAERISVPGVISGKVRLLNGTVVPVIVPDVRGLFCWSTKSLVESIAGPKPPDAAVDQEKKAHAARQDGVMRFLDRVYFEHRNLGTSASDRAVNYAGTNAFSAHEVYESAIQEEMELDTIEVERSPVCRPDSDCWDVKLHFFYPQRQVQTVRKVYRFTIDVSDLIPVTVGPVRSWFVR